MGVIRNIINKVLPGTISKSNIELHTQNSTQYIGYDGNLYQSDLVRACIRPFYKSIGKLTAKHICMDQKTKKLKINSVPYMKLLLEEPNPYMTGQMLREKLAIKLKLSNNAFALIYRDDNGIPIEIYPINFVNVQTFFNDNGPTIRFALRNGKILEAPYKDLIHLRNDFNENDILGDGYGSSLNSLMNVITHTDQGIINAIKNSAVIKWLLKYNSVLRPEDLKASAKIFSETFLDTEQNGTGVAAVDSKMDAQQIKNDDYVPNALQMDRTTNRILNLFGTNEKIIQSKYSEDEWNAYYEAEIEPIALQLSNEFTRKLFTRKEMAFGNVIVFESSNLQYASMSTKLNLVQFVDRGMMTPNEVRAIMNLAPIDGGDDVVRRLDTAVVAKGVTNVSTTYFKDRGC